MAVDQRGRRSPRPEGDPPPQAVMGLLSYLTATSLDEDYAVASERRARSGMGSGVRPGRWGIVALAVFGVLVATAAVQTSRNADVSARSRTSLVKQAEARRDELNGKRVLIRQLQGQIVTLQAGELAQTARGRAVQSNLARLGVLSGGAATTGPGIEVRVDD